MIPTTVDKDELSNYFTDFGSYKTLSEQYNYLDNFKYGDQTFGIPSLANVLGIVYNKAVFEKAGVTEIPKTPDEFIAALQKICCRRFAPSMVAASSSSLLAFANAAVYMIDDHPAACQIPLAI